LDHLFVCTAPGAPEAEKLVQVGFHEGPQNQHPGQGTACRRFSFANARIELFGSAMKEKLEAKVLSAPCFGKDGLAGNTTSFLSEFACGLPILKTQGHIFRHGRIGRRICQIRF
jgi:hypothetical protein